MSVVHANSEQMAPHSLQIITPSNNNSITLNEEALRHVLTKEEIRDRYVSVISITGVFRQGKSFLLNFLLRYLQVKYIEMRDVTDWLSADDGPLKGFTWSAGSKRDTAGIHMWSEIFLTQLPTGEKVAIILLDTQGSFDNQTTFGDCAKIFALSTLISSVQIYNVMRHIKQYDLTHLQCFGGYGSLLTNCGTSPFQNLCILVRDWAYPYEHPYGEAGGMALLEEVMCSNQAELKEQTDNVKGLFEKVSCFLLPYPGRAVDASNSFNGDVDAIDHDFKLHVQDFVSTLLSPENLILKSVNGMKVKAEDFMYFIEEYCKVLREDSLPKVETLFKATVEAHHKAAARQAFKFYKKNMDADVKRSPRASSMTELYHSHASYKMRAVNHYNGIKKFDDEAIYDKYLVDLKNDMDVEYKRYMCINEEKLRKEEEAERTSERIRLSSRQEPGSSRMSQIGTGEAVGIAATVIGGAAVLAFGASKLFSSSRDYSSEDAQCLCGQCSELVEDLPLLSTLMNST